MINRVQNSIHIAVLIMAKNEKKCLQTTLESIKDFADSLVFYDTGSEDNTIEIAKTFCKNHNISFRLKEGVFENFAISRNVSLDFADTFEDIDYILLLDVNDQLRGGDHLREFCKEHKDEDKHTGFLVCQEWWSGQYDKYYNMRLVKARKGWRYRGSVHEWMKDTSLPEGKEPEVMRIQDKTVIYQDRTQDDDKTGKRFERDKELLLKDHRDDPTEPRTVFYLAQTCACLHQHQDALYYYKVRTTLEGFQEEKFHSLLRVGDLMKVMNHPWHDVMGYYMRAFEHSARAEPLIKIADYYKDQKQWHLAFSFINLCCELTYPEHCILFVDKMAYDYKRWHLLGIIGFYCNKMVEGRVGCLRALEFNPKSQVDKDNLVYYEDKKDKNKKPTVKFSENVTRTQIHKKGKKHKKGRK